MTSKTNQENLVYHGMKPVFISSQTNETNKMQTQSQTQTQTKRAIRVHQIQDNDDDSNANKR